jgi:hypothetical protein
MDRLLTEQGRALRTMHRRWAEAGNHEIGPLRCAWILRFACFFPAWGCHFALERQRWRTHKPLLALTQP